MVDNKDKSAVQQEQRKKNLEMAIGQISKEYGEGAIMRLGDQRHQDIPTISTGALTLDIALGIGGIPRGRVTEIYGPESSGKTTLCLHIIANAQKANGVCAFVDTEHALDPQYARTIGVDTENLLVAQPDCGEDALNIAETLVRSNSLDVLIVDSVAALVPRAEIEGQMGDSHVGLQARLMSQALRKLTGIINRSRTSLIFTNQIREKIGVMFGNPETTPGGRALKFYASVRVEIRKMATIKASNGDPVGSRIKTKIVKNKMAPPFRIAEFDILFAEGISRTGSMLDVALDLKLIEKRGSWFSFEDEQIGQGRDQARTALKQDPELQNRIMKKIRETLNDENLHLPDAITGQASEEETAAGGEE